MQPNAREKENGKENEPEDRARGPDHRSKRGCEGVPQADQSGSRGGVWSVCTLKTAFAGNCKPDQKIPPDNHYVFMTVKPGDRQARGGKDNTKENKGKPGEPKVFLRKGRRASGLHALGRSR